MRGARGDDDDRTEVLLEFFGFAMLAAAAALVAMDLVKLYRRPQPEIWTAHIEWRLPARLAALEFDPAAGRV